MALLIFDFDGTIADTGAAIRAAIADTLKSMNCAVPDFSVIRKYIGLPLPEILDKCGNIGDPEKIAQAVQNYRERFNSHLAEISIFPDAREVLTRLKNNGFRLAIASNRGKQSLSQLMKYLQVESLFDYILGEEDVENPKPAPDMAQKILERSGEDPRETFMIGDAVYDMEMGKRAGVKTCGVTYGNHSRAQIERAKPDYMADSFLHLENILEAAKRSAR